MVKMGETAVDWVSMENLARKIAESGMPMMANVPKIRLQPAKGCSWKTFLIFSRRDAAELVVDDAC